MKMKEFVLNYMFALGGFIRPEEINCIATGIELWLRENGIDLDQEGEYYEAYVKSSLKMIEQTDIKQYFKHYDSISKIRQVCIEFVNCETVDGKKRELRNELKKLYDCGLGDKYLPSDIITVILEKNSSDL